MAATDTLIDKLFDGRYRIVRRLGSGGMANVYLAEDEELGRQVAIKILNDRHSTDDQFVERFRREAKSAAGLSHPNIVSIYDRGEAEGTYYIAMEYLEGRTLKELIVRNGPPPIPVAVDYTRQILTAVGFAHRNGIVHRDIKPHNVLVNPDGRLKVTDFGIARSGASQMTEVGSIIGTAQYLSPEQARGAPVDETSDLYSVAIVLYEMLTGTVPFTGDTPVEIAMKHLQETPVPPSRRRPADLADEVPPELDMIVLRALGKEPPERYQSAEDFDADLRRAAGGLGVAPETEEAATSILSRTEATVIRRAPAPPAPTIPVTTRPQAPYRPPTYYDYDEPPRRRAIWPWLLGILLIASALVAGFYLYSQIQEQLKDTTTASVPFVEGLAQQAAENQIREAELEPKIVEEEHETVPKGQVIRQDPSAGLKIDKGSIVTLTVSSGKPKTDVPDVRGKTLAEAASQLATAGLQVKPVQVPSDEEAGVVTAQDPKPGTSVVEGTTVRINVSKGPELIAVPTVVGEPYENALGRLQGLRFFVGKREVVADAARGIVVDQSPPAGTLLPEGSQVTLTVSKGPKTNAVPDVTSQTEDAGRATVRAAGFAVQVTYENVTDPTQDGLVLFQTPEGGTQAKPGSRVTLVVGRLLEEEEPPPPTTAPTTTAPVP